MLKEKKYKTTLKHINDLKKTTDYRINGILYHFAIVHMEGGKPYGYCHRLKKWAYLYDNAVHFEDGDYIFAEKI